MPSVNCPYCGSADMRTFAVIHAEGTSVVTVQAEITPHWNTRPFSYNGKQKITGTHTVKTALAKRCSPPHDPNHTIFFLSAFPGFVIGGYSALVLGRAAGSFVVGLLCFFLLTFGSMFILHLAWIRFLGGRAQVEAYRDSLATWHRSWLCLKCGKVAIANQ
jgi:hypothetical protein